MTGVGPSDLHVSGGAGSTAADYADMQSEARLLGQAGDHLTLTAVTLQRDLADPDVALSAVLDPGGAAKYEAELAAALDGPHGLLASSGTTAVRAQAVNASVWLYQEADAAGRKLLDAAYWSAGYVAGKTAPAWAPLAAATYFGAKAAGLDPDKALQDFLVHHAGLTGVAADAAPGLLDGLASDVPGLGAVFPQLAPTGPADGAALLGLLYPDGHASVGAQGGPSADTAPTSLQGLLTHLEQRDAVNQSPDGHGSIGVQRVTTTGADGQPQTRWIVDLPGTSAWPLPGEHSNVTDDGTNFHSLANERTTYEDGVEQALRQAGVQPGQPIMLVGHSQGGMVAVQTASDLAQHSSLSVTDVVTAGSPVARMDVPPSVHVLSLENSNDIVPQLDGAPNPETPNHLTVSFDSQQGSVTGNHGISTAYGPAAHAIDQSADPSIAAWRDHASGFFTGSASQTQAYQITRRF